MDNKCPETLQIKCVDDIRAGYPVCQKAAEAGGSDMIADLNCLKYFNQMKDKTTSEKMNIYNSEKAKGTSDADILDMIFAYNDAQPEEYRKMTGWGF